MEIVRRSLGATGSAAPPERSEWWPGELVMSPDRPGGGAAGGDEAGRDAAGGDEAGDDRLATLLLRTALDPRRGRVGHPKALEICLRAALFCDLAWAGRITDAGGHPAADGSSTGDRILDSVLAAVRRRPRVSWRRWFHHVAVDRAALAGELVAAHRWDRGAGWSPRGPRFIDLEADATAALARRLVAVTRDRTPGDEREAVLVCLAIAAGALLDRPRPVAVLEDWAPILDASLAASPEPAREAVRHALRSAAMTVGVPRAARRRATRAARASHGRRPSYDVRPPPDGRAPRDVGP